MRNLIIATVVFGLLVSPFMVQAQFSVDHTHSLDPKDRKTLEEAMKSLDDLRKAIEKLPPEVRKLIPDVQKLTDNFFSKADALAKEHVLILIPRKWYDERQAIIEKQQQTITELNARIKHWEVDKLAQIQGAYHYGGYGCAVKVIDRTKNKLQMHFPMNDEKYPGKILDASYDPVIDKIEVYRDGMVVLTGYFGWKTDGSHTITFAAGQYWSRGSAN